jgi:hypothetical protein
MSWNCLFFALFVRAKDSTKAEDERNLVNTGHCPKCNSTEIYRGTSAEGEGLSAGSYSSLIEVVAGNIQTTLWLETCICCSCGYIEMRVANRQDLAVLPQAEGWEKVVRD